jgi:hypothetical protein
MLEAAIRHELSMISAEEIKEACTFTTAGYISSDIGGGLYKDLGTSASFKQLVLFCRAEMHDLLCLNSAKYKRERADFAKAATGIVGFIAGLMISKFGISSAAATAIAVACLTLPAKISINAWCQMYRDNALSRKEQEVLEEP